MSVTLMHMTRNLCLLQLLKGSPENSLISDNQERKEQKTELIVLCLLALGLFIRTVFIRTLFIMCTRTVCLLNAMIALGLFW